MHTWYNGWCIQWLTHTTGDAYNGRLQWLRTLPRQTEMFDQKNVPPLCIRRTIYCSTPLLHWLGDGSHRIEEHGHQSLSVLSRFLIPVLQKKGSVRQKTLRASIYQQIAGKWLWKIYVTMVLVLQKAKVHCRNVTHDEQLASQVRLVCGGCTHIMHGDSRMTIDPRILTMPGRSTSGYHRPGRHLIAASAKRCEVFGESHEGWAASY